MGFTSKHFRRHGRGTKRIPGTMNKVEAKYAAHLDGLQRAGEIEWFKFEGVTLKLAPDCRLTVDFFVMLNDGTLEAHDVKGTKRKMSSGMAVGYTYFAEEDAIIKIRTAAELFPFRFCVVYFTPSGWGRKDFSDGGI